MKNGFLVSLIGLALMPNSAAWGESDLKQLATEYLEVSGTRQTFDATVQAYADQAVASQPGANREAIVQMLDSLMGWEVLKEPTTEIIMKHFSAAQLEQINAFYTSDAGRVYAQEAPAIAIELSNLIGANMQRSLAQPQP